MYLRKSTDRDDMQVASLSKQAAEVARVIQYWRLTPIELAPESRSARYVGRPVFEEMIRRIERGEAQIIVVWEVSRLSRNPQDGGRIIHLLDSGRLKAIVTPSRVYRNTTDDKFTLGLELVFSKRDNDGMSDRIKGGFQEKRRNGQYPGQAFCGYVNVGTKKGAKNLALDDERAPLVNELFALAETGTYTEKDLHRWVREVNLTSRNGTPLAMQTIVDMLQRRAYTGYFSYGGDRLYKGTYPAIVTPERFERVQVAMGWAKPVQEPRPTDTSGRPYLVKGMMRCGTCGCNITAYTKLKKVATTGEFREYVYVKCTHKSHALQCRESQMPEAELVRQIQQRLSAMEIREEDAHGCLAPLQALYRTYISNGDMHLDQWRTAAGAARRALDMLDEKLEAGVISDARYKERAALHEEVIRKAEAAASAGNHHDKAAREWFELAEKLLRSAIDIGDTFAMADLDERRRLMRYVGSNWTLAKKNVCMKPKRPVSLILRFKRHARNSKMVELDGLYAELAKGIWDWFSSGEAPARDAENAA